ncbi:MAG: hypothetical protein V4672_18810 [Verrucomicrobiota bacterium]
MTGVTLERTIQHLIHGMIKLKTFAAWIVFSHVLHATNIAVPGPEEVLATADAVAVAKLSKRGDVWILDFKEVLKGDYRPKETVVLSSPYPEEAFSVDYLARLVGDSEFLFVGKRQPSGRTLQPTFALASFWPQGISAEYLPERTLEGCIGYAKKTLGLSMQSQAGGTKVPNPGQAASTPSSGPQWSPSAPPLKSSPAPKASEAKPVAGSEKYAWATLWPVWAAVAIASAGLLWLLLKKRK